MNICFNVIYNHRYDKNISKIEKLYLNRFRNIYHLMPFYKGNVRNVIPVFESSHNFQGFFNQAYYQYFDNKFDYYIFIGDDLILNPQINENNIANWFQVNEETAYIKQLEVLSKKKKMFNIPYTGWYLTKKGLLPWDKIDENNHGIYIKDSNKCLENSRFLNIEDNLPSQDDVKRKFLKHGMLQGDIEKSGIGYPLLLSFSDLTIIPRKYIKEFCYFCGLFAAANLHAELAIPTALSLSCENISTEKMLKVKGLQNHHTDELIKEMKDIQDAFSNEVSYIHPIKLSKVNI